MTDIPQAAVETAESIYALFKTDHALEKDGITVNYGKFGKFRVARAGGANSRFSKVAEAKMRPIRRQIESGVLPDEEQKRVMAEIFAESVVLGWEGVRGKDGQLLSYSKQACTQLLIDLPDLLMDLNEQAGKLSNFREIELETDKGN